MKNKNDILKKTTLSTLSGAILVSSVPVHVFADVLNIDDAEVEQEQETSTEDILEKALLKGIEEDKEETNKGVLNEEESRENDLTEQQETGEGVKSKNETSIQSSSKAQTVVNIPDVNLETTLRGALNKPTGDITQTDMESLTRLEAIGQGIKDLSGLEYAVNLRYLNLHRNQITDISVLESLTQLDYLVLSSNRISDISALSGLTQLTVLNLGNVLVIEDIEPLRGLTRLTELYIDANRISDISPLSNLTNLSVLYMQENRITDFSPIKDLVVNEMMLGEQTVELSVTLESNAIQNPFINKDGSYMDIPTLPDGVQLSKDKSQLIFDNAQIGQVYNLTALGNGANIYAELTIEGVAIVNIPDANLEAVIRDALNKPTGAITQTDMESLKTLTAKDKGIEHLTGLEYAINLKHLNLFMNNISDIECLKEMKKLESLNLSRNKIVDLTPLSGLTSLVSLEMYTNFYSDVSPLASLTNLARLDLGNARVNSIEPLRNLTNLTFLAVQSNPNIEVEVLSELVNLTSLNISNSRVSDISSLSKLTKLSSLYLEGNQIENIDVLSNMDSLYYLNISNNKVSDLSPLEGKSGLEVLLASDNQIRDVSPLSHLPSLNRLELANNQIMDFSSLGQLSNLNVLVANNQKLTLTIPEGYTNLINPLKDVNGDVIPLQNPSEGTVLDNGKTLQFDSLVAGETIYAEITDPTYQGQVTINVVNNLPTTNINIEQVTVGAGDKELRIAVVDGFYDIEKIILPDGSEVLGNQATFTVTTSGDYTIKAYDIAGNEFIETVSVTVTSPIEIINQAPVLEAKDIVITQGDKFNPLDYVTATDAEDNDSTLKAEVIKNTVNISQCGVYEVTYKVTDSQGASSTKTIQVTVNPKAINLNQAPVIEAKNLSIFVGYDIDLLSLVTATDAEDGEISVRIVSSDFDNAKPGVYSVTYEAVDSQGAKTVKSIEIVVREPLVNGAGHYTKDIAIAPNEELDIESIVNEIAKDKGLTDVEIIENNVDTSKPGDYGVVFEGTNTKKEQEIHSIKVTVMAEVSSDKEDDSSSTNKPSGESVETGLTSATTITLGGLFTLAGIPFLKRKRK